MESTINVFVRSRPLFDSEARDDLERNGLLAVPPVAQGASLAQGAHASLAWSLRGEDTVADNTDFSHSRAFTFNGVLPSSRSNAEVFEATASPLIASVLAGVNCSFIAYGQTGSGKTHSILGTPGDPGMLPRSVQCAFERMDAERAATGAAFAVSVSYLEVYNEEVFDLLRQGGSEGASGAPAAARGGAATQRPRSSLRILGDDPIRGAVVEGLLEVPVHSFEEVRWGAALLPPFCSLLSLSPLSLLHAHCRTLHPTHTGPCPGAQRRGGQALLCHGLPRRLLPIPHPLSPLH